MHGWIKLKGIMLNSTAIDTDYSDYFIPDECKEDFYERKSMWVDREGDDDGIYDDDEIIGHIEDYADSTFEDWKKNKKLIQKKT